MYINIIVFKNVYFFCHNVFLYSFLIVLVLYNVNNILQS